MKKIILIFIYSISIISKAQDFIGYNQSNYAGINGIYLQPASIADGRLKFDLNLTALNLSLYNNYIGINRRDLNNQAFMEAMKDGLVANKFITLKDNDKDKRLHLSNRIMGPSFMFNFKRKYAIGFTSSVRNYVNIDGVSQALAKLAFENFDYPLLWKTNLNDTKLSFQEMSWAEYGLTYAQVIKENDSHYLKAGVTLKLLQGIQSAYLFVNDLDYNFSAQDTLSIFHSDIHYGHSDNLSFDNFMIGERNTGTKILDFSQSYPGFSFDIGAVYEWRPSYLKYQYSMDGEKDLWRKDQNKYKLKLGFSITDIGSIKFKKSAASGDFNANIRFWDLNSANFTSIQGFNQTIKNNFVPINSKTTYRMNLPTAISLQADYLIWKDFYVNLTPFIAFTFKNNDTKVHDFTSITLTPRYDHKWFGAFLPIQYHALNGLKAGTALRIGPVIIGTSNLGAFVSKKELYGADFYTIIKIPILNHKVKDKDEDGISNKKDLCKDLPGTWEFMGCPDKDGDHIKDSEDKCPDIAGTKDMQGCPDKDEDGITDAEDDCPDEKGLAEFKGCADKDGDKIIDKNDLCPEIAGLADFSGCPDKDQDKVPDKEDECPDVAGSSEMKGCPDKDGDKIIDKNDLCPEIAGLIENKGCPSEDTDKDGVADKVDNCPAIAGLKELNGCPPNPVLKEEEQKILERAFESLEFATGKDLIKTESLPALNDLAELMKLHSNDWELKLSGHTDNEGDQTKNLILSEKRVKAVKKYLSSKGASPDKVITEWFGSTIPIADNNTEEGRKKNRRVEMKVEFKK